MKTIRKKAAVILIFVMILEILLATGSFGQTAFAANSSPKIKIKKLRKIVKKYRGRARLYTGKKRRFSRKMKIIRKLLKEMLNEQLRRVLNSSFAHNKRRAIGAGKRVHAYRKKVRSLNAKIRALKKKASAKIMYGKASWYGGGMREHSLCAAMRGFRGKRVKVTNTANGRSVTVVINDYGPATWTGRVIDLSKASFARIGALRQGVMGRVKLEIY